MSTKVKTPEAIMKANLAKTMGRLKTKVAKSEDLWLEWFSETAQNMITHCAAMEREVDNEWIVKKASLVASLMLDAYEERWGWGE